MFRFDLWEKRKEEGEGGKREREQDWEEGRMGGREKGWKKKNSKTKAEIHATLSLFQLNIQTRLCFENI